MRWLAVALTASLAAPIPSQPDTIELPVRIYRVDRPVVPLPADRAVRILHRIPVEQPVVFITIDDGYARDSGVTRYVRAGLPITTFLITDALEARSRFFGGFARAGARIENHTRTHPELQRLDQRQQRREICGAETVLRDTFGGRRFLFRPPYGVYDEATLRAMAACDLRALILWNVTLRNRALRTWGGPVRPGDIILLHWNAATEDDLAWLLAYLAERGLGVGSLEAYVGPG